MTPSRLQGYEIVEIVELRREGATGQPQEHIGWYTDYYAAEHAIRAKEIKNWIIQRRDAVMVGPNTFYLIEVQPRAFNNITEDMRRLALSKLTKEERKLLGLPEAL